MWATRGPLAAREEKRGNRLVTQVHAESNTIPDLSGLSVAAAPLSCFSWLRHGSTTRAFSSPDSPRLADLQKMQQHLSMSESFLAFAQQKHTNHVGIVDKQVIDPHTSAGHYQFPETDALVCMTPNVTIAIMTADCAPVFLVDARQKVIALVHAGWKGTFSRIAEHTVQAMHKLGSDPADIHAWVGPMAGSCCYEVSDELVEKFLVEFREFEAREIHTGRNLDLVGINCLQLEKAGLAAENVHRSNLCTIHQSDRFYSYRADNGTHGRIISAMAIVPEG